MNKRLILYLKVWLMMGRNSFLMWFNRKSLLLFFLGGKTIRYIFYFVFLYFLVNSSGGLVGFSPNQTLFFTATYLLIDTLSQFLYRSVYTFRQLIVTGDFDLILLKPINSLFRVLLGGPDFIDFITLPPIFYVVFYLGSLLNPTFVQVILYILLVLNGLVVATAFHILALSVGIVTLEIDHTMFIFRDLTSMARLPVDIYKEPIKSALTFLVPVGIMITIPAKVMMGLVSPLGVIFTVAFGLLFLTLSFRVWHLALKKYSSASS